LYRKGLRNLNQLAPTAQPEHSLTVVNGPDKGATYKLVSGRISLGRGTDNTIILKDDPKISRQHALIIVSAVNVQITDLSERKKTLVNGTPIRTSVLVSGAVIQIGETRLIYKTESAGDDAMSNLETVVQTNVSTGLASVHSIGEAVKRSMKTSSVSRPSSRKNSSGNKTVFYSIIGVLVLLGAWLALQKPKQTAPADVPSEQQMQAQINSDQKIVSDLQAAKEKEGRTTRSYEEAQGHFIRGFRDYQKGQYQRAMESFQACKSLFPEHSQCKTYYILAQNKFDLLIQTQMILATRYKDQNQYDACYATYRNVIVMLGDKTNHMYQEAVAGRDACQALGGERY
jgi:pSer/pThr/pTyr-binding forkhead associated (FHA) protein